MAGQAESADRALARLEQEYADRTAPLGEHEAPIVQGLRLGDPLTRRWSSSSEVW